MNVETIEHLTPTVHDAHIKPSVFVYGPQGCGKGMNAQAIRVALDLDTVVDDWHYGERWPTHGALILTCEAPPLEIEPGQRCMSFDEAMEHVAAYISCRRAIEKTAEQCMPAIATVVDAPGLLHEAADAIASRAALRDCPNGERSMARCVAAFNAITGRDLSEVEGWHFMELLKLARATAGGHNLDDHTDRAAYAALAGEAAERAAQGGAQ